MIIYSLYFTVIQSINVKTVNYILKRNLHLLDIKKVNFTTVWHNYMSRRFSIYCTSSPQIFITLFWAQSRRGDCRNNWRATLLVKMLNSSLSCYNINGSHKDINFHKDINLLYILSSNHHHHLISFMELGHLLTRSGLKYPEVSSKVYHDSFCQLGSSTSLPWVI